MGTATQTLRLSKEHQVDGTANLLVLRLGFRLNCTGSSVGLVHLERLELYILAVKGQCPDL